MVNYWIFIAKDHKYDRNVVSAITIIKNRVENKFWILNKNTRGIKKLKPGDKAVFYATSIEGRGFCGWGELATEPHPLTPDQMFYAFGKPSIFFELAVDFKVAEFWPKLKPIEEFASTLSFLKGKPNYIRCFRGSIRAITQEDFEYIISA
ncbi:MAG: EVE domain-containing protein [Thaumarchaeota archaeon]|nr:EVE domain-containing protein [Candidatus Terraquivivens yellowstonensis]